MHKNDECCGDFLRGIFVYQFVIANPSENSHQTWQLFSTIVQDFKNLNANRLKRWSYVWNYGRPMPSEVS